MSMGKTERPLPNKKRKPANQGRVIRVSTLVYDTLNELRTVREGRELYRTRSWDKTLRALLGLPDRRGRPQPLIEGMLEVATGLFLLKLPQTPWEDLERLTYKIATTKLRRERVTKTMRPIRMRELHDASK